MNVVSDLGHFLVCFISVFIFYLKRALGDADEPTTSESRC